MIKGGKHRGRGEVFGRNPLEKMAEDPTLLKMMTKNVDASRKAPISRFRFAKVMRLTIASMDRLRFAMPWCPGHATMATDRKWFFRMFDRVWCPSGPLHGVGTTECEAEQAATAEAAEKAAEAEEEEAEEAEAEEAEAAEAAGSGVGRLDSGADAFEEQALALLALEFPKATRDELIEKWAQGGDATGIYSGRTVVHALVVRGDTLLGFLKGLVGSKENYWDELLIAEAARGQKGAQHLMHAMTTAYPKVGRLRLMVSLSETKGPARKVYVRSNFSKDRPAGRTVIWDEPEEGCQMMGATRGAVHGAVRQVVAEHPLPADVRIIICVAGEGASADADGVGSEEAGAERAAAAAAAECEAAGEAAGETTGETMSDAARACDGREMREDDVPDDGKGLAPSHGVVSVVHALQTQLVPIWYGNDVMPHSVCQRVGIKITCDAATLMNAPRAFRTCTTIISQILCAGVRPGNWAGAVKWMVRLPQSCLWAFPLRTFFGKDNRVNLEGHLAPIINEIMAIEKNDLIVDLPQVQHAWSYQRTMPIASGMPCTAGGFTQRALATLPGTKKNKHVVSLRIVMGMRVHLKLAVMFAFDGATTIAASGNSFAEGDLFSRTPKEMMNIFLHAVPIAKGETLADVARRLVPPSMLTACGTLSRRDAKWVSEYVAYVNRHSANADLQAVTAEPERQPQAAQAASIGQAGRKGKDAALFGKGASDGRTAPKLMPFVDPRVTRFRYVSSTFIPTIDGNLPNAWNTPATRDGMVRMPIFPTHFDKPLVKAVWDWSKHADITCRLALCIIHCGMRTMESCLKGVLGILREKYEAGKGDHQALIDHHLNRVLSSTTTGLGLRRLISTDKTGALNDVTLNGGEVRALK